jgi:hypothetical protein
MSKRVRKEDYNLLFSVLSEQGWLLNYRSAFSELLAFCVDRSERSLVCDLLRRFTFITLDRQGKYCDRMAKRIAEDWGLPENETQIVAMTIDNDPDSAQLILTMLKPHLAKYGWGSVKMVNRFGKCVANLPRYPKIIFVDDFVGSGTTVLNRIRQLRDAYKMLASQGKAPDDYEIRICVVACMEKARTLIESQGMIIHAELWLKKGITQHYKGKDLRKACKRMLRMEARLESKDNDPEFPFGYKRTEALYAVEYANASNNLFPVFWWERIRGGKIRKPLFIRKEHSKRWLS